MNNMRNKILMTLALLITAVGGAWAEKVTVTFTQADLNCTGTVAKDGVTLTPSNGDAHSYTNLYDFGSTTFSVDKGKFTKIEIVDCSYGSISGWQTEQTGSYQPEPVDAPDYWVNLYTLTWTGEAESVTFKASVFEIQRIVFTINKPDVDVTLNEAKTEASFEMPTFDTDVDYELVRDMSVQMTAQVGDGTQEQPRYRVKKDGNNKFIPADMEMAAVPALFTVNDAIEQKALTQTQDYIVQIYAIDAEGQPTGQPMTFATFTFEPGIYAVKAVAAQGSDYDGETALSNTFKLFQGYEVEVAAKEFITYYKDEPLYVEDEAAVLYTVSSVNGDQAVLSAAIETAPSLTPLLIFNNSDEAKTFLLIPASEEPNLQLTVAPEFQGTLTGTTIAASTENVTNYALNGKAFVFVKNAIEVGPNKAWLSVNTGEPSARITLVFDEATGVGSIENGKLTIDNWYDLNGRKLDKMPTKKGVYIMNGHKVVIK